ncbi:unnamed protein product [Sphacelaria rigidula]
MQTMYSGLAGLRYLSIVDLASKLFQFQVAKEDRHITAFRDARGHLWQHQRCGFGLQVLSATFHRTVSEALLPARSVKN